MSNASIILKKSSVAGKAPLTGDIVYGEVALNYADGRLYYKDDSNNIRNFIDSDLIQSALASLAPTPNVFTNIAVAGQTDVIAESSGDTLHFAAGPNIVLTTDAATDTVTISSTGSSIAVYNDSGSISYYQPIDFTLTTLANGTAALQPQLRYLDSASNEIIIDLPVSTGAFSDSATVQSIIDSDYIQARQLLVDSASIINLVDSAYIQSRQLLVDSASIIDLIDSSYIQARQLLVDSASIIQLVDSDYVRARQQLVDSASIIQLVDSDYVQARQFNTGGIIGAYNNVTANTYTGDSSTTVFTLAAEPNSVDNLLIAINGVLQDTSTYTVSGNQFTLDSAPASGDIIDARVLDQQLANIQLTDHNTFLYTPSTPTTVITGADDNGDNLTYELGKVSVYLNGAKLVSGLDFTETSVSTITLASAVDSGDTLEIESFAKAAVPSYGIFPKDSDFTTTDASQIVYTFPTAQYRTVKIVAQMEDDANSRYHSEEILLAHNGTNVYMTTYAQLLMDSNLGTIDADISGSSVRILFSPTYANTSLKLRMIKVDA